jgi:hypothetical protein
MPFYGAGGGEQALGRAERRAPDRRRVTGKGEQELAGGSVVLHPRRIVAAGDGEQATIQTGLHARNTVIRLNSSRQMRTLSKLPGMYNMQTVVLCPWRTS